MIKDAIKGPDSQLPRIGQLCQRRHSLSIWVSHTPSSWHELFPRLQRLKKQNDIGAARRK